MYARSQAFAVSAASSTATAWSRVSDMDGRPGRPLGSSHSSTTFRFTLSRACARAIDRFRIDLSSCSVRVLTCLASRASHWSTSSADTVAN
jgi:hypothetical protein